MQRFIPICVLCFALTPIARAHEHGDVLLHLPPGAPAFATGAFDVDGATVLDPDARVFEAAFGETGPDSTDEPGFFAPAGSLPPGLLVGFDIVDAVRIWNGADFDTISPSTITCERFTTFVTSPPGAGQVSAGFWLDTTGSSGGIHVHMSYYLDPPASPGIYLLTLQLRTNSGTIADPLPIFIVFDSDNAGGDAEVERAVEHVESLIAPPTCVGDVTGDGATNVADFNVLASNFRTGPGATRAQGDLNEDGYVNVADFNILAGDFRCGS